MAAVSLCCTDTFNICFKRLRFAKGPYEFEVAIVSVAFSLQPTSSSKIHPAFGHHFSFQPYLRTICLPLKQKPLSKSLRLKFRRETLARNSLKKVVVCAIRLTLDHCVYAGSYAHYVTLELEFTNLRALHVRKMYMWTATNSLVRAYSTLWKFDILASHIV